MICPHCGKTHPEGTTFCPVTGKPLSAIGLCPFCRESHSPSAEFCPTTGKRLSPQIEAVGSRRKNGLWIGMVAGFFIIAISFVGIWLTNNSFWDQLMLFTERGGDTPVMTPTRKVSSSQLTEAAVTLTTMSASPSATNTLVPSFSTAKISSAQLTADEAGTQATTVFAQDQTFYLIVELANAPEDTKLKAVWTAVEVEGKQPNLLIDQAEVTAGNQNVFTFYMSNNQLWPAGKYKVDLYLNDVLDRTLEFEVRCETCINETESAVTEEVKIEPFWQFLGQEIPKSLEQLIPGWVDKKEPGQRDWRVTVSSDQDVIILIGWCAINQDTLAQNLQHISWDLVVDGERIDLTSLAIYDIPEFAGACNARQGIVRQWPTGEHILRRTHRLKEIIHDGWNPYPSGEYMDEFTVTVAP